jgi:DNA-binding GntR family transcriptional regulator
MNLTIHKKTNHYSFRDYVYEILRENIINLNLHPGLSISEKEIATELRVSRTPVREAFVRLAQEELLEVYPQRGTVVALIDSDHVEDARFVREHLEKAIVRLACEQCSPDHLFKLETNLVMFERCVIDRNYAKLYELDEEFHRSIAGACGKERTWSIIQQMNAHLNRIRMLSLASQYNWETILLQHQGILKAITDQNPNQAEKVMHEHLTMIRIDLEGLKRMHAQYFKNIND